MFQIEEKYFFHLKSKSSTKSNKTKHLSDDRLKITMDMNKHTDTLQWIRKKDKLEIVNVMNTFTFIIKIIQSSMNIDRINTQCKLLFLMRKKPLFWALICYFKKKKFYSILCLFFMCNVLVYVNIIFNLKWLLLFWLLFILHD